MNKALIVPLISLVALLLKRTVGYEMPQSEIDVLVEAVLAIAGIVGVMMSPKKKDPP